MTLFELLREAAAQTEMRKQVACQSIGCVGGATATKTSAVSLSVAAGLPSTTPTTPPEGGFTLENARYRAQELSTFCGKRGVFWVPNMQRQRVALF